MGQLEHSEGHGNLWRKTDLTTAPTGHTMLAAPFGILDQV